MLNILGGLASALVILAAIAGGPAGAQGTSQRTILPEPTGPYGIGTYAETVVHSTRREIFTEDPNDTRRLPVRIHYPVKKGSCAPQPYFPAPLAAVYSEELKLAAGFEKNLLGHSCPDVPIASGAAPFPVVLFSHGFGHSRYSYISLIEDLASHGNIVVSIDHSYGTRATYFHDAPLVKWDNYRWGRGADEQKFQKGFAEYPRLWADDMRYTLDLLMAKENSPLQRGIRGKADFGRIAYVGHSFGGRTAIHATQHDARIKGGINLDGNIRESIITPITSDVPFLVLNAENVDESKTYAPEIKVVRVKGADHITFSDWRWLQERFLTSAPAQRPPLSGEEGIRITREVIRLFLDCTFARRCTPLDQKLASIRATPAAAAAASK